MRGDKAAVYLRASSQRQATRGYGLQIQEESCQKYCNSRGYEPVETYQDTKSGVNQERPGLQALLSELDSRGIRLEFSDVRLSEFEETMQNVLSLHG